MPRPKKEQPSARKRIKARGALPSPIVAPKRTQTEWYQRRSIQAAIAFGVVFVGLVAFFLIRDLREGREERRLEVRSLQQFERKLQLLNAPLTGVYQAITTAPEQLTSGTIAVEDYNQQAQGWVDEFRKLYTGIRETEVKQGFLRLEEAKAQFAQGAVIMVDAAKALQMAGSVEGESRTAAVNLGRNLLDHAGHVISMGERSVQRLKNEYDLNVPELELQPPAIPEEEAPPPVPPVDPSAPQMPVVPSPDGAPAQDPGATVPADPGTTAPGESPAAGATNSESPAA